MIGKIIFKYTCFIFAFLISIHHTVFATIPQHTTSFYVNDFADVLTPETTAHINQRSSFLDEASGAQIVVTTVNFTDGMDAKDYAMDMFNEWGIGDAVENNGILILLVIGEDYYYIATGDGIDNIISIAQLGQISSAYLEDNFELGNYDEAVLETYDAIYNIMERHYNVSFENGLISLTPDGVPGAGLTNDTTLAQQNLQSTNTNNSGSSFFYYFFLLVIFIMLVPALSGGRRRRRLGRRSSLFWWLMPSPLSRNRRNRNTYTTSAPPSQPKARSRGNSTPFGGGGRSSGGGIGRGGSSRLGGGGRSSGGGVGRRR